MIKSANDRDFISDILSQFIDGYVDIAKGPWIIEMGATPTVASTYMFLVKLGVPIEDVVFFMNQPIIRDYLQKIENAGYSYLFIEDFADEVRDSYSKETGRVDKIPSAKSLEETMGMSIDELSPMQKQEQAFMLGEFLKYAKMAEQLFYVTQGTNFDTASFNDPFLVFKKGEQLKRAQNTIISSPDDLLNNSFLRTMYNRLKDVRDAYGELLISDKGSVRNVLENVLRPYVNLNDKDFLKVSQKAVMDLFDWVAQNDKGRNTFIKQVLLDEKGAVTQVYNFVKSIKDDPNHKLRNNQVVKLLNIDKSDRVGGANNLFLANKDNKVYDQDNIIDAFRELRDYIQNETTTPGLYSKLVGVSVLQSGLSNSRFSFTKLLPYEDFAEVYSQALYKIGERGDLNVEKFYDLGVFQRNNWNNDDIVPYEAARLIPNWNYLGFYDPLYNLNMKFDGEVANAIADGRLNPLVKILEGTATAKQDYVVYTWEDRISKEEKARMRKDGDYSFIHRGLFKKVYLDEQNSIPAKTSYFSKKKGKLYVSHVYQMINAWGDGYRANELYNTDTQSVINNGFIKVEKELPNNTVANYFKQEAGAAISKETTAPKGTMKLKDGVTYGHSAINAKMLEDMGYTPEEAGKILKSIC